jgi:hypothetical protein
MENFPLLFFFVFLYAKSKISPAGFSLAANL